MKEWERGTRRVDALILTALRMEFDAVLEVDAGAVPSSAWVEMRSPFGLPVAFRSFVVDGGRPLRVAVAVAPAMGGTVAVNTLLPLVGELEPRCVAMCGVCAGRRDKGVRLGDVVAAERLFYHDTGKQLPAEVQQDLRTYPLDPRWKAALDAMAPGAAAHFQDQDWFQDRPVTRQWREHRALVALRDGVPEPWRAVERALKPGEWAVIVTALRERGLLAPSGRELTDLGRKVVDDVLLAHMGALPDLSPAGERTLQPFQLHVAPIGSGTRVIEDDRIWTFVSRAMRSTLGLEMEAAALGELVHYQRQYKLDAIVMKGVMDFADHGRDDHFKEFAARASAECLLWFLREQLPTAPAQDFDDILTSGTRRLPDDIRTPSRLLSATYQIVRWRDEGRSDTLAALDAWVDAPVLASVHLLHGEGGVGKTRLAIEWVRRRRERFDVAGFLVSVRDPGLRRYEGRWLERLCGNDRPVIIVVDYAESRSDLRELLHRVATLESSLDRRSRIRVLLLARNNGPWWKSLPSNRDGEAIEPVLDGETLLRPLTTTLAEREAVFVEASREFAERTRRTPVLRSPIALDDVVFERTLYLHMAALAAVEGLFDGLPSLAASANLAMPRASALLDKILEHEEHLWEQEVSGGTGKPVDIGLARQLVAAATLRGQLPSWKDACDTYERLKRRPLTDQDTDIIRLLHNVYTCGDRDRYLPGLKPDLLGEGMLVRVADPPDGRGEPVGDDWIDLVIGTGDDPLALTTTFMVLAYASPTHAATVASWIARLLRGKLDARAVLALRVAKAVGRRTPSALLGDLLAEALERDGSFAIAIQLDDERVPYPTVSLRRVGEWETRIRLEHAQSTDDDASLATRAQLLNNWGLWLASLDRRESALAATQRAADLYRILTSRHRGAYLRGLVTSLNHLGLRLLALDRCEEAIPALDEAVQISREWAARDAQEFQPRLATSLLNLGMGLSSLGRREAAFSATREGAEVCRALVSHHADDFQHDLALSLTNLSKMAGDLGQREYALQVIEEAVVVWKALAAREPDAFQPGLAMNLANLSKIACELGRREPGLAAADEAVKISRALASRDPHYRSDLARSLANLGNALHELGQHAPALTHTREAIDLYQQLAGRDPALEAPLALCVRNLGLILNMLGQFELAVEQARDAVGRYRALAAKRPDLYRPDLAGALLNLGKAWFALGEPASALAAARECAEIYRELAAMLPDAFDALLATSLAGVGVMLGALREHEPALDVTLEAVELCRALVARDPETFRAELARCLTNLGYRFAAVHRYEPARAAAAEAVQLYRPLAARHPDRFHPELAMSLHSLGARSNQTGQRLLGVKAIAEAVQIYAALVERNPDAFLPELARSSLDLADSLGALSQHEPALLITQQVVTWFRALAERRPALYQADLARSLCNLGPRCAVRGQPEVARVASEDAIALYRDLAARDPSFRAGLALSLTNLCMCWGEVGRPDLAVSAGREAVALHRALATTRQGVANLALSLNNLGIALRDLGEREAAREALCEAMEVYRALDAGSPGEFMAELARALANMKTVE